MDDVEGARLPRAVSGLGLRRMCLLLRHQDVQSSVEVERLESFDRAAERDDHVGVPETTARRPLRMSMVPMA